MTVPMRDRPDAQGKPGSLPWLGVPVVRSLAGWAETLPDGWVRDQVLAEIARRA